MKPKLFVDGRSFDTEYQGTRTYIENLYRVIDQIGDFEIYIATEKPEFTQTFFPGSINIRYLTYQTKSKLKRVLSELPAMAKRYNFHAAHFQYVATPMKNAVSVVTIHDILFKDFPDEFSLPYRLVRSAGFYMSAKRADVLTTVSSYSRKALAKHFRIPPQKIHVVPNGVGPFYFKPYDKTESQKFVSQRFGINNYLLYVSRLEPRKNQLALLEAYLDLKLYSANKQLVFVGKKSISIPQMETLLESLDGPIRKQIHFLEDISNADLRSLYQAADLFIYPSKAEGFGIPPLEAAALNVPTICSNSTAMADFDFFGSNHISPEKNSIQKAIKTHFSNPVQDNYNISEIIRSKYSWEKAASTLNQLILEKVRMKNSFIAKTTD